MQLVEIVEIHVRFHLSQDKTDQFIVMTVFLTTDQNEVIAEEADLAETVVVEDLVDAEPADMAETDVVVEDLEETDPHERCIQLHVQSVEQNAKFHSNQTEKSQFIVMTAFRTRNQQEKNVADISHFYTNNLFKNY